MRGVRVRSVASVELARIGLNDAEIAGRIGVKGRSTVTHYRRGTRVPDLDTQDRIMAEWPHIRPDLWRKPWVGGNSVPPPPLGGSGGSGDSEPPPSPAPSGVGSSDLLSILEGMIRTQSAIERDTNATPEARTKASRNVLAASTSLARLRGDLAALDEAKIVRSQAFRRVQSAMLEALKPWPKAMLAVGKALREFE